MSLEGNFSLCFCNESIKNMIKSLKASEGNCISLWFSLSKFLVSSEGNFSLYVLYQLNIKHGWKVAAEPTTCVFCCCRSFVSSDIHPKCLQLTNHLLVTPPWQNSAWLYARLSGSNLLPLHHCRVHLHLLHGIQWSCHPCCRGQEEVQSFYPSTQYQEERYLPEKEAWISHQDASFKWVSA